MVNVKNAVKIVTFKYPSESYTVVWIFDQSSCHKAFAEDSLNARRRNVRPGGAQPKMRTTTWAGKEQKMVYDDGTEKGMRAVLEERGRNTINMKADDRHTVLSFHEDFQTEKTIVQRFIVAEGQMALYLPKFHCELNPIERVWDQAKCYTRQYSNYSLVRLRSIVNPCPRLLAPN